ncbi:MAG: twin-arginine translocase TatA/TatE family subunit [Coriobacteriia bacterium]|nr:twin-arginine translocase TatA/TatE family subunit [Coriobacteriia bacterium]
MEAPTLIAVKFLGMGMPELIIILIIAVLIFGPKNLPKLGASLGKTVRNVREGMEGKELDEGEVVDDEDDDDDDDDEDEEDEAPPKKKKSSKKN